MPTRALAALSLASLATLAAAGEELRVDPAAGNSTFTAVFDAPLGERITAQSPAVDCRVEWDEATGLASGTCAVALASVRVDGEETKAEHFRQWATHRKSDPAACLLEARFEKVRLGALAPEAPVPFSASVPFTICGRGPVDGRREAVRGTALLFPAGSYGPARVIRVRATVEGFDREAYQVGPAFTEGWLARVQSLAKVVAARGTVELSLFARASGTDAAATR